MSRSLPSRFRLSLQLIVVLFLSAPSPLHADSITAFYETKVGGVSVGVGALDTLLTPMFAANVGFLSIAVDLNGDGIVTAGEWLIQNDAIPMMPTEFGANHSMTLSTPFDLDSLSLALSSYNVYEAFGDMPIGSASLLPLVGSVPFSAYDIGNLQDGRLDGNDAGAGGVQGATPSDPTAAGDVSGQDVIGRVRYDIPGILQGENECGPVSAAQSLLWLKARYGDLDSLPAQATLIADLKDKMKFDDGIKPANYVPGKNAVIDKYHLPIATVSGGAFDGAGTFDFIKQQIEHGQDVEMRIQYTGDGGHWVTIAGWYDDGSTKKLYFKDPLTGSTTVDEYVLDGTTIKNYKYGNPATMSFAVEESIVPEPSTVTLFGLGLVAIGWSAYRDAKRRRTASSASRAAL